MTLGLAGAAALSGRTWPEVGLVAAAVLTGQLLLGWVNDLVDRERDREAAREGKPIAEGRVDPGNVTFVVACAVLLVVPLSIANGTAAGLAHLGFLAIAWFGNLALRRSRLSWLPWALSFALLPAFLAYGGSGGGMHGSPPTIAMTVVAALLGIGVHFLRALPDLVGDNLTGMRHLPLRIALRTGAPRLLVFSSVYLVLVAAALVTVALGIGLRQ